MVEPRSENSNASRGVRWTVALIVFLILGIVGYSGFARARRIKRMKTCQENLTKIDGAKEQWALENNKTPGTYMTESDLRPHPEHKPVPRCPFEDRVYILNPIGTDPVCTTGLTGHSLSEIDTSEYEQRVRDFYASEGK